MRQRTKLNDPTLRECIKNCQLLLDVIAEVLLQNISLKQACASHGLDMIRIRRLLESLLRMCETDDNYSSLQYSQDCHSLFDGYENLYQCVFQIPMNTFCYIKLPYDYRESVDYLLSRLNATQKDILIRRFGLQGHGTETLRDISQDIGLSPEGVRIIEIEAIRQLKQNNGLQILRFGLCLYHIKQNQQQEIQKQRISYMKQTHDQAIQRLKTDTSGESLYHLFQTLPINQLNLSRRSSNCLKRQNLRSIYDVLCFDATRFSSIKGIGQKSAQEITASLNAFLSDYGLTKDLFLFLYKEQSDTSQEES